MQCCRQLKHPIRPIQYLLTLGFTNAIRYYFMSINNFTDKEAANLFAGQFSRKLPQQIQRRAMMRLTQLNGAAELDDLNLPPSNRLEQLRGNRKGQFSIRINQQFRVCFRWENGNAHDVVIVDYHRAGRN